MSAYKDFFLLAFTGTFQGVIDVVCEWGSLFVITMENKGAHTGLLIHTFLPVLIIIIWHFCTSRPEFSPS